MVPLTMVPYLTVSSKAHKPSDPLCLWRPKRYHPESPKFRLEMVTVNTLACLSSMSVNRPFCVLSEVTIAWFKHVESRFPLQMYFRLLIGSVWYWHVKDTEPSSLPWILVGVLLHMSVRNINNTVNFNKIGPKWFVWKHIYRWLRMFQVLLYYSEQHFRPLHWQWPVASCIWKMHFPVLQPVHFDQISPFSAGWWSKNIDLCSYHLKHLIKA